MKILITGGCGYIGSHVCKNLSEAGHDIVVVDNLSTGFRDALINNETLVEMDLADRDHLSNVFRENAFDAVIHFAASIIVPESVAKPTMYYRNNTVNALNVIECAVEHGVKNFVFSSTAAVYGNSREEMVTEESPVGPTNPYGKSKLIDEWILSDVAQVTPMKFAVLRYFNVAGADMGCQIGQRTKNATHLIKVALECALGQREQVTVYGDDYPTKDGTGVRDYIHVEDLAEAHKSALEYLVGGGKSDIFNCGYGRGFSVLEVLEAVKKASGVDFNVQKGPRRDGDIGALVADSSKLRSVTGWTPRNDDLDKIVASALAWEKKLLNH